MLTYSNGQWLLDGKPLDPSEYMGSLGNLGDYGDSRYWRMQDQDGGARPVETEEGRALWVELAQRNLVPLWGGNVGSDNGARDPSQVSYDPRFGLVTNPDNTIWERRHEQGWAYPLAMLGGFAGAEALGLLGGGAGSATDAALASGFNEFGGGAIGSNAVSGGAIGGGLQQLPPVDFSHGLIDPSTIARAPGGGLFSNFPWSSPSQWGSHVMGAIRDNPMQAGRAALGLLGMAQGTNSPQAPDGMNGWTVPQGVPMFNPFQQVPQQQQFQRRAQRVPFMSGG